VPASKTLKIVIFKIVKIRAYFVELSRAQSFELSLATRKSIAFNAFGMHLINYEVFQKFSL